MRRGSNETSLVRRRSPLSDMYPTGTLQVELCVGMYFLTRWLSLWVGLDESDPLS